MKAKKKDFQMEVSLGLALIVLVMIALNLASHYALFRVRESLENQVQDELTEAAVAATDDLLKEPTLAISDSALGAIKGEYGIDKLSLIPMTYERVLQIQKGAGRDSAFAAYDSSISAKDLRPLLHNHTIYRFDKGRSVSLVFFPAEHLGSRYVVVAGKQNPLLGSVEDAGKILIFFAILGIAVIIYSSIRLIHFVIYPFNRLKEKAAALGKFENSGGNEVGELIDTYEGIINDLKNKEEELRRLNEFISKRAEELEIYNNYILKSIQTGIITIDRDGKISTINHAAATMLGIENDCDRYTRYREILNIYPQLLDLIDEFLADGETVYARDLNLAHRKRGGIILSASITPLLDSHGNELGLSLMLDDRTEAKRLQEELELNRRMASLGEMSGGLAHQLRNSTAAIIGLARLVDKKTEENAGTKENLGLLLREAKEAAELVGRFLDFARPLRLEGQEFDPEELLMGIAVTSREKYREVEITVESRLLSGAGIKGDPLLLKQALGNLIDNACKAVSANKGKVTVSMAATEIGLEIKIADNGPGIPTDMRDKIFTPFYSGSPSGAGLGLPLAQKIIALHGGQIRLKSKPGDGTIFTVVLPQSKNPSINKSAVLTADHS